MEISGWDLRKAMQFVTDKHYETIKDTDAEGLTKREYFDLNWYSMAEDFTFSRGGEHFIIKYDNDKVTTLKFLRYFLVFVYDGNLEFRVDYEYGTARIIIFSENIDENMLKEIMALFFWENNAMLPDFRKTN